MKPLLSYSIKTGLMALGLAAGLATPALSAPTLQTAPSVPSATTAAEIIPVREGWAGGNSRSDYWRHNRGNGHWQGNQWRRNNWHRPYYRDNWHGHRSYRRHYGGSGIYFGLGGFGLGPAYDYYAPNYYYAPRRTYRVEAWGEIDRKARDANGAPVFPPIRSTITGVWNTQWQNQNLRKPSTGSTAKGTWVFLRED